MTTPVTESTPEWLTSSEAAALLGIAQNTLYNWNVQGVGPEPERIRRGRVVRLRYRRSVVEAYKREHLSK